MNTVEEKAKRYKILNRLAIKGETAIFGSDYLYDFPFYTFTQKRASDYVVYNRSIEGLTVKRAKDVAEDCLKRLEPKNVLVSFGENELMNEEFYGDYGELISVIRKTFKTARICILQTRGSDKYCANRLNAIAKQFGADFISINEKEETESSLFGKMSSFFRRGKISFVDAFSV